LGQNGGCVLIIVLWTVVLIAFIENRPEFLCKKARLGKGGRRLELLLRSRSWRRPGALADPMKSGDRVKKDRRDAMMLAKLHHAGDPRCRARGDARLGASASDGRSGAVQGAAPSAEWTVVCCPPRRW
jgi:hypothetical protein